MTTNYFIWHFFSQNFVERSYLQFKYYFFFFILSWIQLEMKILKDVHQNVYIYCLEWLVECWLREQSRRLFQLLSVIGAQHRCQLDCSISKLYWPYLIMCRQCYFFNFFKRFYLLLPFPFCQFTNHNKFFYTRKLQYEHFTPAFWLHNYLFKFKRWFCTQKPVSNVRFKDFWYTKINPTQICNLRFN